MAKGVKLKNCDLDSLRNTVSVFSQIGVLIIVFFIFCSVKAVANDYPLTVYTIKKGDTLSKISKILGLPKILIKNLNRNVDWLRIIPGEKIYVPLRHVERNFGMLGNGFYIVKRGDTLDYIEKRFHVSYSALKKLNFRLFHRVIHPGDVVFLPFEVVENNVVQNRRRRRGVVSKRRVRPGMIGNGFYIVKRGDTLGSIALMFGLSVEKIRALNPYVSSLIKPGEIIRIPKDVCRKIKIAKKEGIFLDPKYIVSSKMYKVKHGDSLWKLSHKFGIDEDLIKLVNNLKGSRVYTGQILFIPYEGLSAVKRLELELSVIRQERRALVEYAESAMGDPYMWGGDSLKHGADCSGFVQQVFRKFHIYLPRTAQEQYYSDIGRRVDLSALKPGDLLFFHTLDYAKVTHVAIYLGDDRIIQELNKNTGVIISRLDGYYLKHFIGAKRIIGAHFLSIANGHNRSGYKVSLLSENRDFRRTRGYIKKN